MRKYALLKEHVSNICEVMIFSSTHETYVFLYDTLKDTACFADFSFEGLKKQKSISKNLELLGLKIKILLYRCSLGRLSGRYYKMQMNYVVKLKR